MNKRIIAIAGLVFLGMACSDFPDPVNTIVEDLRYQCFGQNQKGVAGEYLTDSIVVNVLNNMDRTFITGMKVNFEVISGDGEVDRNLVTTDNQGNAVTRWKLGTGSNEQVLEAHLYTEAGEYRSTIPVRATAFIPDSWNTVKYYPDVNISDMAADTLRGITYAIAGSTIYTQGSRFFDWTPAINVPVSMPRRIFTGSDLTFYITTWDGRLFKSQDHGSTWVECAKPWADHPYYFFFQVTADHYMWATALGKGLRCSRDGGQTWQTDTIGLPAGELLGDIFRLSDGTLFFHSLNCNLSKSTDDGHTWTKVNAPSYSLKLYVTDDDELILINQDNGLSIYKSTDKGGHFVLKRNVHPLFGTLMDHTVHRQGSDYYLLIPGYGILRTTDFEKYDTFWGNVDAMDMLMDANGNFLVRDLNMQQVHYLFNH